MSALTPGAPTTSQQAVVEAVLVLLERMGLSPADLVAVPREQKAVPTFAEYVPVVSAAVSAGPAGRTACTGTGRGPVGRAAPG
jgi:lipid-binding SYLF domain-containing protein